MKRSSTSLIIRAAQKRERPPYILQIGKTRKSDEDKCWPGGNKESVLTHCWFRTRGCYKHFGEQFVNSS